MFNTRGGTTELRVFESVVAGSLASSEHTQACTHAHTPDQLLYLDY